jgi:membrane associated rhomboid family serine protease
MRITFDSPVILTFSFLCAGVYLLSYASPQLGGLFVLKPEWEWDSFSWYFRLFSHGFGHANIGHIMANLSFILLIGPIVERRYGTKKLMLMMLTVLVVTSLLHITFFNYGLLGASGIVFMLILLVSAHNVKSRQLPLTFILVVIIFIGAEIMRSFEEDNISHFAHIIGGVIGTIFAFLLKEKKGGSSNTLTKETKV